MTNPFTGVGPSDTLYCSSVCLAEQGVPTVPSNGLCNPHNTLTPGQQMQISRRLAGLRDAPPVRVGVFTDVPASGTLRDAVEWAY
jgi:hypothetical protein